jgi:hypothetical protein
MSFQLTVLDLGKQIKIAREHACLGLYPESLAILKNCLKIIQK